VEAAGLEQRGKRALRCFRGERRRGRRVGKGKRKAGVQHGRIVKRWVGLTFPALCGLIKWKKDQVKKDATSKGEVGKAN